MLTTFLEVPRDWVYYNWSELKQARMNHAMSYEKIACTYERVYVQCMYVCTYV